MTERDDFLRREREYDNEKRKKFEDELRRNKEKVEEGSQVKLGLREKLSIYRKRREYGKFQKFKVKQADKAAKAKAIDVEVYGHEQTAQERSDLDDYKLHNEMVKERRIRNIKRAASKLEVAGSYGQKIGRTAGELLEADNAGFGASKEKPMSYTGLDEMFNVNYRPQKGSVLKRSGRDPLVEMYSFATPETVERRKGFKKGLDVADFGSSNLADFDGLTKPKSKRKGGLYDDLLMKGDKLKL